MTYKVLGVGLGLFILAFSWCLAGFLCFISFKAKKLRPLGVVGLFLSTIISLILLNIPQNETATILPQYYLVDRVFILRIALVIILGLSLLGGFIIVFLTHWNEPILAKPLKNIVPRCLRT